MTEYKVISENDNIDAVCFGNTWSEAVEELLILNGYSEIIETDWTITCESGELVKDGIC